MTQPRNIHAATVEGFGQEWDRFDQSRLADDEAAELFDRYFSMFKFDSSAEGFDLGCGSGRWAKLVAPRVGLLHCIDPSDAIEVARRNLARIGNVRFHRAAADRIPLTDGSQDFGYALGVLHHIPDPERALVQAVKKLRPGGQMLIYIYYALENRSSAYRALWRVSDAVRKGVSRLPFAARRLISDATAALIYWPLARTSLLAERLGANPSQIPLSSYRSKSFYTLRTDALDRFGTKLEQRFTREQIEQMMRRAGLEDIRFSDEVPYWVAIGRRAA